MIKEILKRNHYIYKFYKLVIFKNFINQQKEILFLRNFTFKYCLDIGANVGTFTLELQNYSDKVFCFEPLKENIFFLKKIVSKKSKIFNFALGDKNVISNIHIPMVKHTLDYAQSSLKLKSNNNLKKKSVLVKVKRFDHIIKNKKFLSKIDFIKIDVEGYEYEVLCGMKELLKIYHPILLIEIEKRHNINYFRILKFLTKINYKAFIVDDNLKLHSVNQDNIVNIIEKKIENNFFFIYDDFLKFTFKSKM